MTNPGIFPPKFPKELAKNPLRRAELEVYKQLRNQLEGFTIFYNCPWLDTSTPASRADGEADFIVAHPKWGFVVLEVKGGEISRDEHSRIWRSRNHQGQTFKIKNPIDQARTSKHVILRKIRDQWKGSPPFIRIAHGVIFPDSSKPSRLDALGADMPLDIFLFREDMKELGSGVVGILMAEPKGSTTQYDDLGVRGIEILHGLFDRGFNLRVTLSTELDEADDRILKLTEQQKTYLDFIALQRRAVITGGAGTGKTTLALEKSSRLAKTGASVLLLCFNNSLAKYLEIQTANLDNVTASSFHQFCIETATQASISVEQPDSDNPQHYFEALLPDALLDALSVNDNLRFDAIIVDEGQDFHENWWPPLLLALKEDNGVFYVFKDDNQRIYGSCAEEIPDMPKEPLHLSTNFRNTTPIFSAAAKYYEGGELRSGGPQGKDIIWRDLHPGRANRDIERLINELTNIEGIPEKDIAVLCACTLEKSTIHSDDGTIGRYKTRRANELSDNSLIFDSIFRFKGLESKVVILTDCDLATSSTELLYVGLSRARLLLAVAATDSIIEQFKNLLSSKN